MNAKPVTSLSITQCSSREAAMLLETNPKASTSQNNATSTAARTALEFDAFSAAAAATTAAATVLAKDALVGGL